MKESCEPMKGSVNLIEQQTAEKLGSNREPGQTLPKSPELHSKFAGGYCPYYYARHQ